jgi:hypothetical protein
MVEVISPTQSFDGNTAPTVPASRVFTERRAVRKGVTHLGRDHNAFTPSLEAFPTISCDSHPQCR